MRQLLTDLAAADGPAGPGWWGSTLMLLIDGGNARVVTTGETTAIDQARDTAEAMIATAETLPLNREDEQCSRPRSPGSSTPQPRVRGDRQR